MKKELLKNDKKGITLIALVITIIVLLILAGVTIVTLTGDNGLLKKASNAVESNFYGELEEQVRLAALEAEMNKYLDDPTNSTLKEKLKNDLENKYGAGNVTVEGTSKLSISVKSGNNTGLVILSEDGNTKLVKTGPWVQDGNFIENKDTKQKVEIGDKIYYNSGVAEYEGTGSTQGYWAILGVENGNLMLISTEPLEECTLLGREGYLNGSKILNQTCEKYKNDEYAIDARSIRLEDINRAIGKTPYTTVGTEYTYTLVNGKVKRNDRSTASSITKFVDISGKTLTENNSITVVDNDVDFSLSTYTNSNKILGLLAEPGEDEFYWVDTPLIDAEDGYVSWCFLSVINSTVFTEFYLYNSYYEQPSGNIYGARAIVTLKDNVELAGSSSNGWTISE